MFKNYRGIDYKLVQIAEDNWEVLSDDERCAFYHTYVANMQRAILVAQTYIDNYHLRLKQKD